MYPKKFDKRKSLKMSFFRKKKTNNILSRGINIEFSNILKRHVDNPGMISTQNFTHHKTASYENSFHFSMRKISHIYNYIYIHNA